MQDDAKKFRVQAGFQSLKSKQKNSKFQNFPKNNPREPCKYDVYQVSMQLED